MFFGGIKPPKNAYSGYKFLLVLLHIIMHNNALHTLGKKGDFWHLRGGMAPFPLIPPMNSDTLPFLFFPFFFLSFSSPSSYISPFLFSLPFSLLSFSFLYFLFLRLEVRPLESIWGALAPSVGSGTEPQSKSNLVDFNL